MTSPRTLSWLATLAVIAGFGLLLTRIGVAAPLRSGATLLVTPLEHGIERVTSPVADLIGNIGSYGELRDENRDLRDENERLRSDLARLREDRIRTDDLNDLLNLRTLRPTDTFAYAAVIGRDPNGGRNVVAINRGSADGIREGMPALGRGGALVGTVERVQEKMCWVRLLNDPASDVNAVIQESRAKALASGQPGGKISMQFLAQGVEVKPGDVVLTSGLGGSYPAGLLIGRISKVQGGALDTFKSAEIEPAVRLSNLEDVAVLTSFSPLKLGAP
jgi:rod shape-determining protein MreC